MEYIQTEIKHESYGFFFPFKLNILKHYRIKTLSRNFDCIRENLVKETIIFSFNNLNFYLSLLIFNYFTALSSRMIDRIFSGAVTRGGSKSSQDRMSYTEFVWFLLSEEDKQHPTAIEYWFR